jgi:type III secretion protein C
MTTTKISNKIAAFLFAAMFAIASWDASAADLRLSDVPIPIKGSDSYELRDLLKDLLARQGLVAVVSDKVRGKFTQSGRFKPRELFERVVRENSLLPYFDGSVVYIDTSEEAVSRSFAVNPQLNGRILSTLSNMRILDARNTVRGNDRDGVLFVSGARRFVSEVEEIIKSIQSQSFASPPVVRYFPLKFAWATDVTITYNGKDIVIPGVATTLRRLMNMGASRNAAVFDAVERAPQNTGERLRGQGMRADGRPQGQPLDPYAPAPNANATDPNAAVKPSAADITRPSTGGFQDGGAIEADRRTNGLIVRDSVERMPAYEELIRSLDVEPMQVELQAMIIDIDQNKLDELGVGWQTTSNGTRGATGGFGAVNNSAGISGVASPIVGPIQSLSGGISLFTTVGSAGRFNLRVNALAETGAAKIVSRPQVVTLANVEAILEARETVYVEVAGAYEVDLFRVSAGTSMKVVPHFIGDGENRKVRLFITIEDGVVKDPGGSGAGGAKTPPVVSEARVSTQVILMEGESLLLGGLAREETNRGVTKIPLLGDIPYLGNLFKFQTNNAKRKERLFLISPRLVPANRVPIKDTQFIEKPDVKSFTPLPEEKIQ